MPAQMMQCLARKHVPHKDGGIQGAAHNASTVEKQRVNSIRVTVQLVQAKVVLAVRGRVSLGRRHPLPKRIPNSHLEVIAARHYQLAVEADAAHGGLVPAQYRLALAARNVPDAEQTVPAAAHHHVAVERQAAHRARVAREHLHTLARLDVPHAHRPIRRARHAHGARQLRGPHAARVAHQSVEQFSCLGAPDLRTKIFFFFNIVDLFTSEEQKMRTEKINFI